MTISCKRGAPCEPGAGRPSIGAAQRAPAAVSGRQDAPRCIRSAGVVRIRPQEPRAAPPPLRKGLHMLRSLAALAAAAMLALGAAACGDDDDSSATAASEPKPVAQIDSLSGQATEVRLDTG